MRRHCPGPIYAAVLLLGALSAGIAAAQDRQPARDVLGKARTQTDRSLEALLQKLESGRPAPPSEAAKAEAIARELEQEQRVSRPTPPEAIPHQTAPAAPLTNHRAALTPPATAPAAEPTPAEPAPPTSPSRPPESFSVPGGAGQPVRRPAAPAAAAHQPVAPGIHFTPGRPAAVPPEPPPAITAPPPAAPAPRRASTGPTVSEPAVTAKPATDAVRRQPPPPASRRGLCTDILQRAALGDLTEEDRSILRTQCR
jgi:hypothetical protein